MRSISSCVLLFFCLSCLSAQNKSELESKRKELEHRMSLTSQILEDTKRNKSETLESYQLIISQISNREKLISTIKEEISEADSSLHALEMNIDSLDANMERLDSDFDEVQRTRFRNQVTQNTFVSLFSAKSLQDLFLKWRYTEQFREYAEKKEQTAMNEKRKLENVMSELDSISREKRVFLDEENNQTQKLSGELSEKNALLKQLKKNEKSITVNLEKQKREVLRLNNEIKALIRKEIDASRTSVSVSAAKTSKLFGDNKGQLIWPTDDAVVSGRFGKQQHPTVKNIYIENNGIDLKSSKNGEVNAVFEGEVRNIFYSEGFSNSIIVKHGDYYTLYSHVDEVFVTSGQFVKQGEKIGILKKENSGYKGHFEIWEKDKKLNPLVWLRKN